MALNKSTPSSISDIEAQIAKVTAELEKARALQYTNAEKAFLAAQKRTQAAQTKVNELTAKAGTTAAAQSRLALARAALDEQEVLLADATALFNAVKAEQDAADEFAKNVALLMSGKKLGKKIKLSKKEKSVLKEEKKTAKKNAKQDKKIAKQEAKDDEKQAAKIKKQAKHEEKLAKNLPLNGASSAEKGLVDTAESTAPKKAAATKTVKPILKKASLQPLDTSITSSDEAAPTTKAPSVMVAKPAKKAAPANKATAKPDVSVGAPVTEDAPEEMRESKPKSPLPKEITPGTQADKNSSKEVSSAETGEDAVVEGQTIPESENPAAEKDPQGPIND